MLNRRLIKREVNLEVSELPGNEMLVYDRQKNVTHFLESETALVWEKCDGNHRHSDLEQIICSELHVSKAKATVKNALDKLDRLDLLQR